MYFSSTLLTDLIGYAKSRQKLSSKIESALFRLMRQKHISYEETIQSINCIRSALQDEYLGLHLGEQLSLKVTAPVDDIMLHSQTLEAAFDNAVYYSRQISDALDCWIEKDRHCYKLTFEENPNWKVQQIYGRRQILDLTLLSAVNSITTYTGQQYDPVEIRFSLPRPVSLFEYYRLFNCRLTFNQSKTQIVFEKRIFDKHSKQVEHRLLESLKEKVTAEIASLTTEDQLIYELKKCILDRKPERISIIEAAQAMHQSTRTLQRNLRALNTSFKRIENELQLRLSKTYLEERQKSMDEISYLLGFSETSAFIRFFKATTGQTPREYRQSVTAA